MRLHPSAFEMPKLRSPRRGAFSVSDRVAIAEALAVKIKADAEARQLAKLKQNRSGNITGTDDSGDARDLIAAKAGLGSGKTLEAAQ